MSMTTFIGILLFLFFATLVSQASEIPLGLYMYSLFASGVLGITLSLMLVHWIILKLVDLWGWMMNDTWKE